MPGWKLVFAFNMITAAAYVGIAVFIVLGLVRTQQLARNRLAVATSLIFITCAAHHVLHAMALVTGTDAMATTMMQELMGQPVDVVITLSTAITGVTYLALRRSYGLLMRSPAMFEQATDVRYRQLAANLPHTAVTILDTQLRCRLVAGDGTASAGYDAAEMEGRLLEDTFPAAVYERFSPYLRRALAGEVVEFDNVSSVTGRTFHHRVRPLLDDSSRVVGALMVSEDVTDQNEAYRQLAASQAFNAAVMVASPDITMVSDMGTGRVTWSSRSLVQSLGWAAEVSPEAESRALGELVFDEDRGVLARTDDIVRQLPDGESITVRVRMRSLDGYRWLARQSTPFVRDESGAVVSYLSVVRDVTDLVEIENRLEHAALHDPLTNLANRALLLDRTTAALARADRSDTEVAVLFCDLDGFKKVNDTDGHAAGDAVLIEVARRLTRLVRESDSVARVGGDEFVVVLDPQARSAPVPGAQPGESGSDRTPVRPMRTIAPMVAERITAELSRPILWHGRSYQVTASIGITFAPRHARAADVLRDADTALYRAKTKGKNRVEIFNSTLRADVDERRRVETELRNALDPAAPGPAQFTLAFQPVYDLVDNRLTGFEALARLLDGSGRTIAPDVFIPVAEETGLITTLGERVLDGALAGLARWRTDHPDERPATMAVNLSARQAQRADMPELVRAALRRHRLSPSDLILELTESVLIDSGESTLRQLSELHDLGVNIAIDDFGTGYASLRYLADLPVSSVKVDRSFTATMMDNSTSAAIVRTVAHLAADLDLRCVIEGVETQEQLDALPSGVQAQGYLMGRPTAVPQNTWLPRPRTSSD